MARRTRCALKTCRLVIVKPAYYSRYAMRRRQYCDKVCYREYLQARRVVVPPVRIPLAAPDSPRRVTIWEHVPPRCEVCRGPWRRTIAGVCCLICGRDLWVLEALVAVRGLGLKG